jgi:hypothetical protein
MAEEAVSTTQAPTADISVTELITNGRNPRGIPSARFIVSVEYDG